jgi:hypothetical protein
MMTIATTIAQLIHVHIVSSFARRRLVVMSTKAHRLVIPLRRAWLA